VDVNIKEVDNVSPVPISQVSNIAPIEISSIDKVEILDGLKEGDNIVISGTDSFKGAQRVAISN